MFLSDYLSLSRKINKKCLLLFFGLNVFFWSANSAEIQRRGTSLLYSSWVESFRVTREGGYEDAKASFAGFHLSQRSRVKFENGKSFFMDFGILWGQAQAGNSLSSMGYLSERKNFFGAVISPSLSRTLSKKILFKLGPSFIYRSIRWQVEEPTMTATSGADINILALGSVEFRVSDKLYFEQAVGGLAFNGRTFWSFGLGYVW